ncbi:MAG: beta-N-acetylhexosaminidase [Vicinamibacterales bacterium]
MPVGIVFLASVAFAVTLRAQDRPAHAITVVPRPVSVSAAPGEFVLTATTTIWADKATAEVARMLARRLEPATGFAFVVRTTGTPSGNRIVIRRDSSLKKLGPEGYALRVRPGLVTIRAAEPAGAFYGVQTLLQLMPAEILREARAPVERWTVAAVTIDDYPRFSWRGGHLDVARHFMPREFVKKYIDLLALHKLNTFHWHLTDDQGWRIEIRKYPKLTEVGSWRRETIVGRQPRDKAAWRFDGIRHGGFYTQEDIREIVRYAADRFVTIVPEVEMPGHCVAAIAAYPELGVDAEGTEVATSFGVFDNILNAEEATVRFMQDVLAEVIELFPGKFIHVGGDEAAKDRWRASERVQARIKELGLANEDELQSWFIGQMDAFLASKGRRLVGWDEILEGGLAPGATVMSWRGVKGGIQAARSGHDVVMAPTSHTYFDYYQTKQIEGEPVAIGGHLPLETVYSFEPVPADLEPEFRRHVLGAQGQLWTEYLKTPKNVEYMAFPRMSALSEVVWTPAEMKDFADFRSRLDAHLRRLRMLDVDYRAPKPDDASRPEARSH